MLNAGYPLSAITEALCERWQPGVRLLPMTDERAETHVVVDDPDGGVDDSGAPARRAIHFQEWWVRYRAALPAHSIVLVGADEAKPGPGVVEAIESADVVVLPPSNPVVSVGTILRVPGIREALQRTSAPVVGVAPIVGGRPVRGMADACLAAIGVETDAAAVARHYGPRRALVPAGAAADGILDGWLVDTADAASVPGVQSLGIACESRPLLMTDLDATTDIARAALEMASRLRQQA
jgi:LPPG:FO 2-phospho-L-lactate transferase